MVFYLCAVVVVFKQKTAYEMRISDWSSDVCSSDLTAMSEIKVVLADDHVVLRAGLRALLEAEMGIEVVGEASTGDEAVDLARALKPTIVVMDLSMQIGRAS